MSPEEKPEFSTGFAPGEFFPFVIDTVKDPKVIAALIGLLASFINLHSAKISLRKKANVSIELNQNITNIEVINKVVKYLVK